MKKITKLCGCSEVQRNQSSLARGTETLEVLQVETAFWSLEFKV